jgi:hypothetical protein
LPLEAHSLATGTWPLDAEAVSIDSRPRPATDAGQPVKIGARIHTSSVRLPCVLITPARGSRLAPRIASLGKMVSENAGIEQL